MRARFWISTVTRRTGQVVDGKPTFYGEVELNAVQRETDDNVDWAHHTPVGKITMTVKPEAMQWFLDHQGQDVYVDLTVIGDQSG